MMEHSRLYGSLPLFTILSSSPCRVQTDAECTQIFLNGSRLSVWVGREDASSDSVTLRAVLLNGPYAHLTWQHTERP